MRLSQSVVLWQGWGGIQKIALFPKRTSPYWCKNSSNKQSEMTVHHYFKTWRSVNAENVKNFECFFKCGRKNHQALWWNWPSWGPPQERKTQSDHCCKVIRVNCTSAHTNASQGSSNRHIRTTTVQRRLCGRIAAKKPLLKDTNKKKRLAWGKKQQQWTFDLWGRWWNWIKAKSGARHSSE
jgi:hypothetical protein